MEDGTARCCFRPVEAATSSIDRAPGSRHSTVFLLIDSFSLSEPYFAGRQSRNAPKHSDEATKMPFTPSEIDQRIVRYPTEAKTTPSIPPSQDAHSPNTTAAPTASAAATTTPEPAAVPGPAALCATLVRPLPPPVCVTVPLPVRVLVLVRVLMLV